MSEDLRPTRIAVLAAAHFLASAGLLWMGLIILSAGSGADAWLPLERSGVPSGFIPSFMPLLLLGSAGSTRLVPALVLLGFAWLAGMTAVDLWRLKEWARRSALVLCAIAMTLFGGGSVFSILLKNGAGLVSLLIGAAAGFSIWYLTQPEALVAFGQAEGSGRPGWKAILAICAGVGLVGFTSILFVLGRALSGLR